MARDPLRLIRRVVAVSASFSAISGRAAATGRTAHHLFTGYLVAKAGEIKLLRESFNPLTMAQAQLPNGVADIGPPGDDVHSF